LFEINIVKNTPTTMVDWMDELNRTPDFKNIQGYPHNISEMDFDKLPTFQGNNVISANDHCGNFKNMILITPGDNTHEYVSMIFFFTFPRE
jgi:hypothetical protein